MPSYLRSRLQNWKFAQACHHLNGQPEEVQRLVQALARLVGDCEWGLDGDLATVIEAALESLDSLTFGSTDDEAETITRRVAGLVPGPERSPHA